MSVTALRLIRMLQFIPREPWKISSVDLLKKLTDDGFPTVDKRTMQRDLNALSRSYPLVSDEREKPYGWSWKKDAPDFALSALDPQTALTLKLAEGHLKLELPTATLDYLSPFFKRANNVLTEMGDAPLASWPDKVRVLPHGQPLLPPRIDPEVQRIVYQALMENRRAEVVYRKPAEVKEQTFEISPLGLVVRNQVVYIVCTIGKMMKPYQLVLHRMLRAQLLDQPAAVLDGFNLDKYIKDGGFGLPTGRKIHLEAIFTYVAGRHLLETALSEDQETEILPDGRIRITATVMETEELETWLRGFGDGMQVINRVEVQNK